MKSPKAVKRNMSNEWKEDTLMEVLRERLKEENKRLQGKLYEQI
ncbi:hypothetical protein [Ammoniphilus sp. 3BR4]